MTDDTETTITADERNQIVRLMLTRAEKQELRLAAARASMAVAVYVRTAALEKARRNEGVQ
jgi:hypothetical protein